MVPNSKVSQPYHIGQGHTICDAAARFILMYSRLSLSRLRLSRITAYLEEKIWSFFKRRNLTSGNKILWIREEIVP